MRFALFTLIALSVPVGAQSITPASTSDVVLEATRLFAAPNAITVNGATVTSDAVTQECTSGTLPEAMQFGLARGFEGVGGVVLTTGWVENFDQESPPIPMAVDPTGCIDDVGFIGSAPSVGGCDGPNPTLSALVSNLLGAPVPTEDAVSWSIDLTASVDTTLDLSYTLATFEDPNSLVFYDAFGITLDGQLLAGGTTNGAIPPGTDPWSLSPSDAGPFEFNSLPTDTFFQVPAYSTGIRTLEVFVPAGQHTIEFLVADSGDNVIEPTCNASSDNFVDTALFVGLHTYGTGNPGAVSPGMEIARFGHPVPGGGVFGGDLGLELTGAPFNSVSLLLQAPTSGSPVTIPLFAPLEIVIGLTPYQVIWTQATTNMGTARFPTNGGFAPPASLVGTTFYFQWWSVTQASFFCSKGMAIHF